MWVGTGAYDRRLVVTFVHTQFLAIPFFFISKLFFSCRWLPNPRLPPLLNAFHLDDEPVMTCHACNAKSCFTHDVPWHTNMTCDEFDESLKKGDNATRVYYEQHTKSCPECKEAIEKNDGCDHMTCRCGHEFCWLYVQTLMRTDPVCELIRYLLTRSF